MTDLSSTHPPDICLLLRAHGEGRWLISEVVPTLRQLEQAGAVPEDELGAALAYLEVLWLDARRRGAETDAAYANLGPARGEGSVVLYENARRYHASVRLLRDAVSRRVARLTGAPGDPCERQHAHS